MHNEVAERYIEEGLEETGAVNIVTVAVEPIIEIVLSLALGAAAGFVLCVLIRQNYMVHEYYIHLIDAPVSLFLVMAAAGVAGRVPVLGKALAFVGKHSMNIYLVHTFFYKILWRPYIYRFRYAGITFLLLLAVCLVYSVALETVKKAARLERLLRRL